MELDDADYARLARLRGAFLAGRGRSPWREPRDLEVYDATFARRIAWKWSAVLDEVEKRGGLGAPARVLDFGCGTGVAARSWLARAAGAATRELWLHDVSKLALDFACASITDARGGAAPSSAFEAAPAPDARRSGSAASLANSSGAPASHAELRVERGLPAAAPDLLLVSHVLGELASAERAELVRLARTSAAVLWVEPGARETSRALASVRDELLDAFDVVAPCTHAERCPLFAAGADAEWCHAFARPPREVFTSSTWAKLGARLSIDLRSVPYSFLALRKKTGDRAETAESERILGRPRIEKGRALVDACGPHGLRALRLVARDDRALFERLEAPEGEALLYRLAVEDGRIRSAERVL
ncbi:MAG: small ribosomal subunit Rsm22 family protein [Planctomycetota bacterium]